MFCVFECCAAAVKAEQSFGEKRCNERSQMTDIASVLIGANTRLAPTARPLPECHVSG